jgi:hypothetical protein
VDQPQLHVSLLENGRVDVLNFLPATAVETPGESAAVLSVHQGVIPVFSIDRITIQKGRLQFDDYAVKPMFKTVISDIDLTVENSRHSRLR